MGIINNAIHCYNLTLSIVLSCMWQQVSTEMKSVSSELQWKSARTVNLYTGEWLTSQTRTWQRIRSAKLADHASSLAQENIGLWATEIIFNIRLSLAIHTSAQTVCTHIHSGIVLHQNITDWSVSPSMKYVTHNCWNMSRLYSTQRRTLSPSICLLSLAHLSIVNAHTYTQVHKRWIMDEPCDTAMIHLSHLYVYTKSRFKGLSLFMPPRVHILSLDICGEAHDGPERWCLTAADTESRLCGHWHRQHLRAWNGAAHEFPYPGSALRSNRAALL